MRRRTFLASALSVANAPPSLAVRNEGRWDDAAEVLERAAAAKQVEAAVLHVVQGDDSFTRHFGKAASGDAMFLLGSISKPINVTAVMTLFDRGEFRLGDRVRRFLPAFTGDGREDVTIRHLLTHVSGLSDQLVNNDELRRRHAPLAEFVEQATRAPLDFAPGARYQYSSMGILLAARIGEIVSGSDMLTLVDRHVFQPLGMKHSAQGLGRFKLARDGLVPDGRRRARIGERRSDRPRSGIGTVRTGGNWALPGEEHTLPRRMSPGSWASSWGPAAKSSSPRRLG